jgi:hypothetical protein
MRLHLILLCKLEVVLLPVWLVVSCMYAVTNTLYDVTVIVRKLVIGLVYYSATGNWESLGDDMFW